ncbi:MAG: glutaredoxin domain-containing protein [Aerococcus sp.]|nr:glutaredoxin domain-containing protein [Aerococcus sp.]
MIKVYSKKDCQQCRLVKRWLNEHEIPFEEVDGSTVQGRDAVIKLGYRTLPVVVLENGNHFAGLDMKQLNALIEQ